MSGRKLDIVWLSFDEVKKESRRGVRTKCKKCGYELEGQVIRMKNHLSKCACVHMEVEDDADSISTTSTLSTSTHVVATIAASSSNEGNRNEPEYSQGKKKKVETSLDSYVVRSTPMQKKSLDQQVARFIFATNTAFRSVEHPQFVQLMQQVRPGYTPPNTKEISGSLLETIYEEEKKTCSLILKNQSMCLGFDGWSNVHNVPIICLTVTTKTGDVYLVDTIDTSGHAHTANYLAEVSINGIKKCEEDLKCKVRSVVTDNAANVAKMHLLLENYEDLDVITYGCSAHVLNLLANDFQFLIVKEHLLNVIKYFRNNHFANACYRKSGAPKLVLPSEVCWNTIVDCLETYLKGWATLLQFCDENRETIDKAVQAQVSNFVLKRNVEDMLNCLKPIAIALNDIQKNNCTISESVCVWKNLQVEITKDKYVTQKFKTRYNMALTPAHFLAYMLDPKESALDLTEEEKKAAFAFAKSKYSSSSLLPLIVKFQSKSSPFQELLFENEVTSQVTTYEWWKSQKNDIDKFNDKVFLIIEQLLTAQASSASVERVFSSFGSVFISSLERSHRFIYSTSTIPQHTESFSRDLKSLTNLWEKKPKSAEVNNFLFKCFAKEPDIYSFILDMMKYTNDRDFDDKDSSNKERAQELTFAILLAFDTWLEQNAASQPDMMVKKKALEFIVSCWTRPTAIMLSKVFKIREDSSTLREYVEKLTNAGKFEDAGLCATLLGIQNELPFEKILLPLIYMGKHGQVIRYLDGHPELQLKVAEKLDSMMFVPESQSALKLVRQKESKLIFKALISIIKTFGISAKLCPNMRKNRASASMNFLIHKRLEKTMSDSTWESMIEDVVKDYPELQARLIRKLVLHQDHNTALKMAKKFNVPLSPNFQRIVENTAVSNGDGEYSELDEQNSASEVTECIEYLSLDVNKVHIQFVRSKEEFYDCLNDISQNHEIVGIDSEWKVQFGFAPTRLSLMQLSAGNKVYMLDMLALDEHLLQENWNSLFDLLFSNPNILKLGCGIIQDVQMLVEDFRGTPQKKIKFSHLLDVAILFEQFENLYKEELEEFVNDAPGTKGLSKLCKIVLGKRLNKDERICNWEIRPLSDSQVTYAALDANCLLRMFEKMQARAKENNIGFEKPMTIALDITTGLSRIALKNKHYRWERQVSSFTFQPSVAVHHFQVIVDHSLAPLAGKLRMFGADVTLLTERHSCLDGIRMAQDENKVYLTLEKHSQEVKTMLLEENYCLVNERAKHDEKAIAHIFQQFNVQMTTRAIFSRCVNCNKSEFLMIPSDDLKKMWAVSNSENCAEEKSDCDAKHYEYEDASVSVNGTISSGVRIQLDKVPSDIFSKIQTFKVCSSCGNVHYQR